MNLFKCTRAALFCFTFFLCGYHGALASETYMEFHRPYLVSSSGERLEPLCFLEPQRADETPGNGAIIFSKCNLREAREDESLYQLPDFYARSKYVRYFTKERDGVDYTEKGEIGYRVRTIFEDQYLISVKKIGAQGMRSDSLILAQSNKTDAGEWALTVKQSYICGGGCNNGLINAYMGEDDFKVNYETMITPIMLYTGGLRGADEAGAVIESDPEKLTKYYESLDGCATCCIGKTHFVEGDLRNVHFNLPEIKQRLENQDISDAQRCLFDKILRANQTAYDVAALDEFLSEVEETCFTDADQ